MISIFIPLYNEQDIVIESLNNVHRYLASRDIEHEVIAVDNGSTDQTSHLCHEHSQSHSWFRFYSLSARGAGGAFIKGVEESRGEHIITLDIDLSSDLLFIDFAIDLLKHSQMVVGSKTMGKQRRSPLRVLGSQCYLLCSQILLDLTLSDYSIGCKAYQRSEILDALSSLDRWTGYTLDLAVYLHRRNRRIVQVGINCDDRRKSHFNLIHEGLYRYWHLFTVWRKWKQIPLICEQGAYTK